MGESDWLKAPKPHRHPLARVDPKPGLVCCLRPGRKVRKCSGCSEVLPLNEVRYKCAERPKPCAYYLCESCFHLGPGEGGLKATASFFSNPGIDSTTTGRTEGEQPFQACGCFPRALPVAPGEAAAVERVNSTSSVDTVNLANAPVMPSAAPPRLAAAGRDFGLEEDAEAQARWAAFAQREGADNSPEAQLSAEGQLTQEAQRCAAQLRFLALTVAGEEQLLEEQTSKQKDRCLELYSPLARIAPARKTELIAAARKVPQACRAMGSLVGMAVGDALGAPFEFLDAVDEVSRSMFDLSQFKGYQARNRFRVKRGQWTDDTSMGLCLADTLLARGCYDGSDARVRFHNWWFRGYNNAFGNDERVGSVGLGGNVAESLRCMEPGQAPPPNYEAMCEDAGNGSLMRLAAVPIFLSRDPEAAAKCSAESSRSTHPGRIAAAAAAFFGYAIARALAREAPEGQATPPLTFLEAVVADFEALGRPGAEGCEELARLLRGAEPEGGPEECWNWRAPKLKVQSSLQARGPVYNGYPCYADYFGSYCIDGLAVALWSFCHTQSFMEAVVRCVNFLGDADTMAAMCGQLAGAFYGYDAIDRRCLEALEVWDNQDVACRAALLFASRP